MAGNLLIHEKAGEVVLHN